METVKVLSETDQFWAFMVGAVIPLLVGLVTKARASSAVKGLMNTFLSIVGGTIVVAADHGLHVDSHLALAMFYAFASSTVAYKTLWKPTGIAGAIQNASAQFGVGAEVMASPPIPPTPPHLAPAPPPIQGRP